MNLEQYRARIKFVANERIGEPIYNASAEHAAIIVEQLLLIAQRDIRILSGDLNSRVYGTPGVVQRAREFIGHSQRRIRILLEKDTLSPSHPLIESFDGDQEVEIRILPPSIAETLKFHAMTADEDCYRFEPEKDNHVAVAAFGNAPVTANLNSIFETLWRESTPRISAVVPQA